MKFPVLPGRKLQMVNGSLELVKALCCVFALDQTVEAEVSSLRRTLLRALHVQEFSSDAEWIDPSNSLIVTDVFCNFCSSVVDIDVCRDPAFIRGDWHCSCGNEYDKQVLETRLVERVQRQVLRQQVQVSKNFPGGLTGLGRV